MQRPDLPKPIQETSSGLVRFFDKPLFSEEKFDQHPDMDPWADSHSEQPFSGGYNEAFVIQFWSSYTLR
jgi:hypothetical protein